MKYVFKKDNKTITISKTDKETWLYIKEIDLAVTDCFDIHILLLIESLYKIKQDGYVVVEKPQPTLEILHGCNYWTLDGELHRDDGPAAESSNGDMEWYLHGILHREDGPAIDDISQGYKEWNFNGVPHRVEGPAIEDNNCYAWWVGGKPHRLDGPAVKNDAGYRWFINGVEFTEEEFNAIRS